MILNESRFPYKYNYYIKSQMHKERTANNLNPNKPSDLLVDQSRFKIGKEIGAGTFGKVYEAVDTKTGQKVAIKEAFQDKKYKNRELQVLLGLQNDNIVQLKNYYFKTKNHDDKYLYVSMELFETNLQSLLKQYRKQKKVLQTMHVKILAFQLFKALYYLKQKKVCHRDLKPPNILINPHTLELRICDFGSSKYFNTVEKNVTYICSRYYRAPELLFDYGMYGTQVDTWSAGCIFVELLTRQPIFPGDSAVQQLIQIIKIIGVPSEEYMKTVAGDYKENIQFPNIPHTKWQRILRKINPDPQLIDLISSILVFDIKKRLTPLQILLHPFFHDLTDPSNLHYTQKLPNLFKFSKLQSSTNKTQIQALQKQYNRSSLFNKQLTSIQKDLMGTAKLETGDSTPLQHEQQIIGKDDKGTRDTIQSKTSIPLQSSIPIQSSGLSHKVSV